MTIKALPQYHNEWNEMQIAKERPQRDPKWTQTLAVGSENFVKHIQSNQHIKTRYRDIESVDGTSQINDAQPGYIRFLTKKLVF